MRALQPDVDGPAIVATVVASELVISAAQRQCVGLAHWIDGTFGVIRVGASTVMCSPNGPVTAIHRSHDDGQATAPEFDHRFVAEHLVTHTAAIECAGPAPRPDHAAGGPLIELPGCPFPILTYHAERFLDGDPYRFHASLGWAEVRAGEDGSVSLHDLGIIVDPPIDPSHPERIVDVGSGPTVLWQGDVWVFYPVRSDMHARCALGAARVPVPQAIEAVFAGKAPAFDTVPATAANSRAGDAPGSGPAVGSMPPDLLPGTRPWIAWLDVAVLASIDQLVMVHSAARRTEEGTTEWNLYLRTSPDGRSWSAAAPLLRSATTDELLYVTIDSGGQIQREIRGSMFSIYYTRSESADRWSDALIERIAVTWSPISNTSV